MEKFVCAFRGRRDSYQVPLALAETDQLAKFITDAYATPFLREIAKLTPARLQAKLAFRHERGIPDKSVRCLWCTTVIEHARHSLGCSATMTWLKFDRHFSEAAARAAKQSRGNLLLYSPYAWEAFIAKYRHTPKRVLFQYHPHPDMERRLMDEDTLRYPGFGESFSGQQRGALPETLARRERDAWRHADLILCASGFTQRSLLAAGCDKARCHVVPYGVEVPGTKERAPTDNLFRAVFVGSGGQRKGLHHLLMAWQNASLPRESKLTLICRALDRGIEELMARIPAIELHRGVSRQQLQRIYGRSTLFVMPSLVEGFGQVYLEAMIQGCPVLGTVNTCLPELGGEKDGVFLTTAGNVDQLTSRLEQLSRSLPGDFSIREAARETASRFTWQRFRDKICQTIKY